MNNRVFLLYYQLYHSFLFYSNIIPLLHVTVLLQLVCVYLINCEYEYIHSINYM